MCIKFIKPDCIIIFVSLNINYHDICKRKGCRKKMLLEINFTHNTLYVSDGFKKNKQQEKIFLFYLYIYSPHSHESEGGSNK